MKIKEELGDINAIYIRCHGILRDVFRVVFTATNIS